MTILFAFTTFWGIGICVLKSEHVTIDALFEIIPPVIKRWVALFNYLIVFIVNGLFFYYSCKYVEKIGNQLSKGLLIPMKYYYNMMPVCSFICAVCLIIKMIETAKAPIASFEPNRVKNTD